jgi:hypothetical protein
MNVSYKKALKIITLLATTILIASVSAQVYSYMYIQGSGAITTGGMSWQKGSTAPAGSTIDGVYVKNLNLSIPLSTPKNFTDCLHLSNNDATSHTFSIAAAVTGGNTSKFTTFDMVVYQSGGARIAKISIKNSESASGLSISGSATLYVRFEVIPLTGETTGNMAFTVTLTYE